jgi:hypothetical protein
MQKAAVDKYEEFHRLEPTKVAEFEITIPAQVKRLGDGVHVLYESGKKDPETLRKPKKPLSYIHEHDMGVCVYVPDGGDGEADFDVPEFIAKAQALVVLGKCLGFAYKDEYGDEHKAEGTDPLPDLCCTVDGRALLVVQSRREILALIWGGALGVEARGIVG